MQGERELDAQPVFVLELVFGREPKASVDPTLVLHREPAFASRCRSEFAREATAESSRHRIGKGVGIEPTRPVSTRGCSGFTSIGELEITKLGPPKISRPTRTGFAAHPPRARSSNQRQPLSIPSRVSRGQVARQGRARAAYRVGMLSRYELHCWLAIAQPTRMRLARGGIGERGARAVIGSGRPPAVMTLDDRAADRSPNPHAFALGRVEAIEPLVSALDGETDDAHPAP